jgi:hypothetical protein
MAILLCAVLFAHKPPVNVQANPCTLIGSAKALSKCLLKWVLKNAMRINNITELF